MRGLLLLFRQTDSYIADPVDVGADLGEDSGLLGVIAAESRPKADDAVNLPGAISGLTVERTTRVSLKGKYVPHLSSRKATI